MLTLRAVQLDQDVPLAPLTTLGVGGGAQYFRRASSEAELIEAVRWADRHRVSLYVLGGGSNLVVSDAGVAGLVLQVDVRGMRLVPDGDVTHLVAAAGEPWDDVVRRAVAENLAGVECLSGIPGRVGATPIQNVGAYGQDVSETITEVRCFDRRTDELVTLHSAECAFAYRDSRLKSEEPDRFVVLEVRYRLERHGAPTLRYAELQRALDERSEAPTLAEVRRTVIELRRKKGMVVDPADADTASCGSFFVNPVVEASHAARIEAEFPDETMPRFAAPGGLVKLSAGWLIEHAGLARGTVRGRAAISSKHALALTALPGARARDVVDLAREVRRTVETRFAVRLVPEPVCWGFSSLDDGLPDDRVC